MRQAASLAIVSTINLAMAFAHQWYVVVQLGASAETDALFAGMTVPMVVLTIISGSVMHVLVPILAGESKEDVRRDAWSLLFLLGGLFLGLFVLLYATATWWVPYIVPGFDEVGQALTVELTRIQLVGMILSAVNGVQWAVYHARQKFIWAEITPLFATVISFALLIWLLPTFGIELVAWLAVFRLVLQTLFLSPEMGMPVKPDFKSDAIIQGWSRIKPLLLGAAYYKTDVVIDRVLLSMATSGSLTLFYMAQRIYGAAGQVFNKALCAPAVPILSNAFKKGERGFFKRFYYRKLYQISGVAIVCLLVLLFFGQPLLSGLIGHGNFESEDVEMLWLIMIWLGGMFFGSGTGQLCASTFYSMGDTKTPTKLSVITYSFFVPLKILSFWLWGVMGLALSMSIYYIVNLLLQVYLLEKRFKQ